MGFKTSSSDASYGCGCAISGDIRKCWRASGRETGHRIRDVGNDTADYCFAVDGSDKRSVRTERCGKKGKCKWFHIPSAGRVVNGGSNVLAFINLRRRGRFVHLYAREGS